ncbi:hypothetical protein LSTR_LSTR016740 [Laodelphax striatellus]|uniref:Uncharacterized protein n=1 Tax=Laodelphax striatellus TaxID=195883 RepID=A0A482XHW4_LAOST|nr:hypothetical protein LSTR_LSTR016740 [Laodelphax striatellus]
MDRGGAAATLSSADLPPGASSANGLELPPFHQQQQLPQKTTTLSTIVVNSGSTRVVIALVQCLGERDVVMLIGVDFEGTRGRTFLPRAIAFSSTRESLVASRQSPLSCSLDVRDRYGHTYIHTQTHTLSQLDKSSRIFLPYMCVGENGKAGDQRVPLRQQNRTLSEMEQSSKVNTFYYRARQYSLIAHPEPPASSDPPPPLFRSYSRS